MKIKIGILNRVTGKVIKEKTVEQKVALEEAHKMSQWFDQYETFATSTLWERWTNLWLLLKFEKLIDGSSLNDVAHLNVVVFKGKKSKGIEHEFYMQRV